MGEVRSFAGKTRQAASPSCLSFQVRAHEHGHPPSFVHGSRGGTPPPHCPTWVPGRERALRALQGAQCVLTVRNPEKGQGVKDELEARPRCFSSFFFLSFVRFSRIGASLFGLVRFYKTNKKRKQRWGDSWFTWWFTHLPGKSKAIFQKGHLGPSQA